MAILIRELIEKKRDGSRLEDVEIAEFINGVAREQIPEYQIAAMLMAIFFRGLDDHELAMWTDAMVHSGDVVDTSGLELPAVDKHSTGGVGDKISLPLAPAAACCGVCVPMISGRGLGHSGGTLDKLESIPGFRVDLEPSKFTAIVADLGLCLVGQTDRLAPADRVLYSLRDVTATIESVPLIASSIMAKKIAEGIQGLVLDCKVGAGAFMKSRAQAIALSTAIRAIGAAAGKKVTVVLTDMDAPIGRCVGNALEVKETIEVLRGEGPEDTVELTVALGGEMLACGGVCEPEEGRRKMSEVLGNGMALERFRSLIERQEGDPRVVDTPDTILPRAPHRKMLEAKTRGSVASIAADEVGMAALELGAGRRRKEDVLDLAVGLELFVKVGDDIEIGQPLVAIEHNGQGLESATRRLEKAIQVTDTPVDPKGSRILEVIR